MNEPTPRRMLPIGLIGAGPEWDDRWKPALLGQSRLKVVRIYDPIALRAESVARDLDAEIVAGVRRFFQRGGMRGVVILDAGWLGSWTVREAARAGIPVFAARSSLAFNDLAALPNEIAETLALQPDLQQRYLPSTMRVRELTATSLGPVHWVSVLGSAPRAAGPWRIGELVDWCRFVVQSSVVQSNWEWIEHPSGPVRLLKLRFRREHEGTPVTAEIRLLNIEHDPGEPPPPVLTAEIACGAGVAWVRDSQRISWRTTDETQDEVLSEDRSSAQVQLDLFARRLAGGLVPTASLEDVRIALNLAAGANGLSGSGTDFGTANGKSDR